MSSRYYLPLKQDVAKYVPKNFQKKENPNCNLACNETQFINRESQMEFWWMYQLLCLPSSSTLNLTYWYCDTKTCKIVEFSCLAEWTWQKRYKIRRKLWTFHVYATSNISWIQIFIPVIVGTVGAIPIDLKSKIKKTWIWWKIGREIDENDSTRVLLVV